MTGRDYRGVTAVILASGVVIALVSMILVDRRQNPLDTTLMATIYGGFLTALGAYLVGPRTTKRETDEDA